MKMSNIDSNLYEGMTWYKIKHAVYMKHDASAEGSLVHRSSNHGNYNTKNNSDDVANE